MRIPLALSAVIALASPPLAGCTSNAVGTTNAVATTVSSLPINAIPSVGKLFTQLHVVSDDYNCTGVVLNTPKRNIVLTVNHCSAGLGKWAFAYFVPGYDKSAPNSEPYGRWTVNGVYDGPDDLEVLVMDLKDGKNIQDAVGGQNYQINARIGGWVSIVGYPSSGHGRPYYCGADATAHIWKDHPDEWQTDCGKNFNDGVSGSPYMVGYDPEAGRGVVVAALGGDNKGSAGSGGELSLGTPLTPAFKNFLQDVLK